MAKKTFPQVIDMAILQKALGTMSKDLKKAEVQIDSRQARFLVDTYYMIQEKRKRVGNQISALQKLGEPTESLELFFGINSQLEDFLRKMLDNFTDRHPMGEWMRGIIGIGPVLSAGILAHIQIDRTHCRGSIHRYAGLDPSLKWVSSTNASAFVKKELGLDDRDQVTNEHLLKAAAFCGQNVETLTGKAMEYGDGDITAASLAKAICTCPYNAKLKKLCFLIGKSFVYSCNHPDSFYGRLYLQKKEELQEQNEALKFKDEALRKAAMVGKSTEAYVYYSDGKLPPAHIFARAKRWTVKMFLNHLYEVWYKIEYGEEPPLPYPMVYPVDGVLHVHKIDPPMPRVKAKRTKKKEK